MGLAGLIKFLFKQLLFVLIAALVILFVPNLPPDAKISEPYTVTPSRPLEGKLALNNRLDETEKWLEGEVFGPEAFATFNNELYTSLLGGDIVKITGKHITPIIKFGKPCKGVHEEKTCGRPLGIQFDKEGNLYAADAYYGIFKVNVKTGEKLKLVDLNIEIEGTKPKLPNGLAVSSNGDIYWTDSSSEFELQDGVYGMLADGSGRLIHYDAKTKKNKVLINNLQFANGVALSDDEQFVIVSETARNRVLKYNLAGPNKGKQVVFIDGLPGMPDNLQPDGKGGFLVPLVLSVDADHPMITQTLGPFPAARKIIARTFGIVELGFKTLNNYYPCEFAAKAQHFLGHFSTTAFLTPARTTILHLSKTGDILDSVHSLKKHLGHYSEALVVKDTLYLASPYNNYIGRIPLAKLGWEHLRQQETIAPKPVTTTTPRPTTTTTTTTPQPTTTPKPTTTTPKPTTTTNPPPTPAPKVAQQKQQTPPPPKPTTPPPPPKVQPTQTPPAAAKQQTPPVATKQQTPPAAAKQAPPAAPKQPTPTAAPKQAPPAAPKQPTPTAAPKQAPPAAPKQETPPAAPKQQQTPPPAAQQQQTPPPPAAAKQQQTTPPAQNPVKN